MAHPPGDPQPHDLPQRYDVWQVLARELDVDVNVGGGSIRPWIAVVVSTTDDLVLTFQLFGEPPTLSMLDRLLHDALLHPESGDPHRPTQIQFPDEDDWIEYFRPRLEALGIDCAVAADLSGADAFLEDLASQLSALEDRLEAGEVPHSPALLDVPGVSPDAIAGLFDAAAGYFTQAPWRRVGERPVQIAGDRFQGGPWYAILMGQGGMTSGLVLYDDLDSILEIQSGALSHEESARRTTALAVVFGDREDLVDEDVAAAREHHWPVAGPRAWPCVYRMQPGLAMRPPLAWEVTLLEASLRALPVFVRKKTRRLAPLTLTVPTAAGDVALTLAWADD